MRDVGVGLVLLAVSIVLGTLIITSRDQSSSSAPSGTSPEQAPAYQPYAACESKKRDFVERIPTIVRDRSVPVGMFISGGAFTSSIVNIEGNGLFAQILLDRATGNVTQWHVMCTST